MKALDFCRVADMSRATPGVYLEELGDRRARLRQCCGTMRFTPTLIRSSSTTRTGVRPRKTHWPLGKSAVDKSLGSVISRSSLNANVVAQRGPRRHQRVLQPRGRVFRLNENSFMARSRPYFSRRPIQANLRVLAQDTAQAVLLRNGWLWRHKRAALKKKRHLNATSARTTEVTTTEKGNLLEGYLLAYIPARRRASSGRKKRFSTSAMFQE